MEDGVGFIDPFAEDGAEVAGVGGGDVLPLGFVTEGEEGFGDEVARGVEFAADGGDEDDGPRVAHAVGRVAGWGRGGKGEVWRDSLKTLLVSIG